VKNYIIKNKKTYDALALEYGERVGYYQSAKVKISQEFINELHRRFSENINVLDLGCGGGLNSKYFEDEKFNSFAIDISEKMIEVSKKFAKDTKYLLGDFLEYDFGSQKFEGIFAQSFIHLFDEGDTLEVMKKIKFLLTEGGIVFIGTTIHDKMFVGEFEKEDYVNKCSRFRIKYSEDGLKNLFEKSGFSIISKKYLNEPEVNKRWVFFILK